MNIHTIVGFILVGVAIIVPMMLMGSLGSYWDPISVAVVLGGTVAALILAFGFGAFTGAIKSTLLTLKKPVLDPVEGIDKVVECAQLVRKNQGSLLSLAEFLKANEKDLDPYFLKALQLAIDGKREKVVSLLKKEKSTLEDEWALKYNLFEKMEMWMPASGMIGTLLGLIQMMRNLNDPAQIGPAMALALITTLYGAIGANWLAAPIGAHVEQLGLKEIIYLKVLAEGFHRMMNNENPIEIEDQLMSFLEKEKRKQSK
ncbi:MAG: MotA/TolQ/ExbB proton channel family protein [Nitrospinae bacterium]|nr:MotA/TolQ/ExbB proton channel family protein [Nitrospinota bacterium]